MNENISILSFKTIEEISKSLQILLKENNFDNEYVIVNSDIELFNIFPDIDPVIIMLSSSNIIDGLLSKIKYEIITLKKLTKIIVICENNNEEEISTYIKQGADLFFFNKNHIEVVDKTYRYILKQKHQVSKISNDSNIPPELFFSNNISVYQLMDFLPYPVTINRIKDFSFHFVNTAAEEFFGKKKQHLIGRTVKDVLPDELAKSISTQNRILTETGSESMTMSEKVTIADKTFQYDIKSILMKNEYRIPIYIVNLIIDRTVEEEREKELKKFLHRFSTIFSKSPIPMALIKTTELTVVDINKSLLDLVEYNRDEVIGKSIDNFNIWNNLQQRNVLLQKANSIGSVLNYEMEMVSKENNVKNLMVFVETITSINEPQHYLFMALDITEQMSYLDELKRSLERERDLNSLKSRFISMISHEFRTPLTTIMLSTDILRRYGDDWSNEEKTKQLDRIQTTVHRMTQLMENVMTIGRLESGRYEFQPEEIDLNSFCFTIAEGIEFNTSGKNKIHYSFNNDCNETKIDENILGLILTNLLSNAVKYSPENKDVVFNVYCYGKNANFLIKDEGIGIPQEDQENLFKTFYRASNVGTISGYGLGLAIVKKCVDAHKGSIKVTSNPIEGTTFLVSIPIK